jgi:Fic family protein
MPYLWQLEQWPEFTYSLDQLLPYIVQARKLQGQIQTLAASVELKDQGELLFREALHTSAIEGENLNPQDIRSSIAKHLGLPTAGLPETTERYQGLIEVLVDATVNYEEVITTEKLRAWHSALFPTGYSGINKITVGGWRSGDTPMNIISGSMGNEKIHFTAPPFSQVNEEMTQFYQWWESSLGKVDGLLRAGIAHLYFVTIHPFEDGNGRLARALTDLALAQEEKTGTRLYSLSTQIHKERTSYYGILDEVQKGGGDITTWLCWFLDIYSHSIESSMEIIRAALMAQKFYTNISKISLNERQLKVLGKMIKKLPENYTGGLTNKKYTAITKVSLATVKRDLKEMVALGILIPGEEKGRSTNYQINRFLVE